MNNGRNAQDGYPKRPAKGPSCIEISRKYYINPRTAKKYAESDTRPAYSPSELKLSEFDLYKDQITVWLEEAPHSAGEYWKNMVAGFTGGHSIVKEYVRNKKQQFDEKATVRYDTMPGLQGQMDWRSLRIIRLWRPGDPRSCTAFCCC